MVEGDEVGCERWFDPKKGGVTLMLDVMVAEGRLTRKWSDEKSDFVYYSHNGVVPKLPV